MERESEARDRATAAAETDAAAGWRWNRVYAGVLAHLALWIGLLWWFSRSFGSAQ